MAVYRVERTRDYTVMSNHHLKDTGLSLKAKGLLSLMLSLPDDWNFNMRGLSSICKEGLEAIGNALKELEKAGYMVRNQLRGANWRITDTEYIIYERPQEPAPLTRILPVHIRLPRIRLYHIRETRMWWSRIWLTHRRKTPRY